MIDWYEIDPVLKNAPKPPPGKPWRVTRYRVHWYWGYRVGPVYGANFSAYWKANAVSWFYHHALGWSCNTWRANPEPANLERRMTTRQDEYATLLDDCEKREERLSDCGVRQYAHCARARSDEEGAGGRGVSAPA